MSIFQKRQLTVNELLEQPLWSHSAEASRYETKLTRYMLHVAKNPAVRMDDIDPIRAAFKRGWIEGAREEKETRLAVESMNKWKKESVDLVNSYRPGKGWRG